VLTQNGTVASGQGWPSGPRFSRNRASWLGELLAELRFDAHECPLGSDGQLPDPGTQPLDEVIEVLSSFVGRQEEVRWMLARVAERMVKEIDSLASDGIGVVVQLFEFPVKPLAARRVVHVAVEGCATLRHVPRKASGPQSHRPLEHGDVTVRACQPGCLDDVAEVLARVVEELHEAAVVDLALRDFQDEHRPLTLGQRAPDTAVQSHRGTVARAR
jgi:hypothetical protein